MHATGLPVAYHPYNVIEPKVTYNPASHTNRTCHAIQAKCDHCCMTDGRGAACLPNRARLNLLPRRASRGVASAVRLPTAPLPAIQHTVLLEMFGGTRFGGTSSCSISKVPPKLMLAARARTVCGSATVWRPCTAPPGAHAQPARTPSAQPCSVRVYAAVVRSIVSLSIMRQYGACGMGVWCAQAQARHAAAVTRSAPPRRTFAGRLLYLAPPLPICYFFWPATVWRCPPPNRTAKHFKQYGTVLPTTSASPPTLTKASPSPFCHSHIASSVAPQCSFGQHTAPSRVLPSPYMVLPCVALLSPALLTSPPPGRVSLYAAGLR
jgi:hypothetical protein